MYQLNLTQFPRNKKLKLYFPNERVNSHVNRAGAKVKCNSSSYLDRKWISNRGGWGTGEKTDDCYDTHLYDHDAPVGLWLAGWDILRNQNHLSAGVMPFITDLDAEDHEKFN